MPRYKVALSAVILAKDAAEAKALVKQNPEVADITVEPDMTRKFHAVIEVPDCCGDISNLDIGDYIDEGLTRNSLNDAVIKVDEIRE